MTLLRFSAVTPLEGYNVRVQLTDGTVRELDLEPYLEGPAFEPMRDPSFFRRVSVERGVLSWPNDVQICPDSVLYTEAEWDALVRTNQAEDLESLPDLLEEVTEAGELPELRADEFDIDDPAADDDDLFVQARDLFLSQA